MAELTIEGMDRLALAMRDCSSSVTRAANTALTKAAMETINDAKRNMMTAGHNGRTLNVTSQLRNSGKVQRTADGQIDAGFFSPNGSRGYAAAVEYGSRPHWTPKDDMQQWVRKKLRVMTNPELARRTYLIRRAIAKRGTKPHPFFGPAVEKNRRRILEIINQAISAETNRNR